ncbi:MAG: hypothetical protein P4L72_11990 [Parvibaculum sp.]|uniref:hypothetical protein n=1 Tax=Parvibaculum sp. TaxID=2024848 RepID=UPI002844DB5D|nr:hypothetical protein [Parvibaculum sp.]MDR3499932.1 hypothetical protein [Parvibaculum sp.]
MLSREKISVTQIAEVGIASQESVTRLGGAIGWGIAGDVLLGPVGLLAGLVAGGRGTNIEFVCVLNDGRKFLATASSKIFARLRSAAANNQWSAAHQKPETATEKSKIVAGAGVWKFIAWAYAIIFGFCGVAEFFQGKVLTGLLFSASAIMAFPRSAELVQRRFSIAVPSWLRVVGAIAFIYAAGASIPVGELQTPAKTTDQASTADASSAAPADTQLNVNKALSKCLLSRAKKGLYTSSDGGKSALRLLGECDHEWTRYVDACTQSGDTDGNCTLKSGLLAQAALKLVGK